ncbi:MAG: phospholipase D-like domain-containing protein, partial [Bacteroidota bacterium]
KVTVFVEVKARFDEANNLKWAKALENEGVNIIYSIPNLKVHAKVALIIRTQDNIRQAFAFFGTGNFNEKTAQIYADHGFFTSNSDLTRELCEVFDYLAYPNRKPVLEHLLVAQINILDKFYGLIEDEMARAKAGKEAKMIIKINNLEYDKIIDKLYEAAQAGVKIELIVRSICCLVPAEKELSENIRVTRIVDRYLEHARIFMFYREGNPAVFLGSSDWMKRNLKHRVEVVFPVYDPTIKQELIDILLIQLRDNQKARILNPEHHNLKKEIKAGEHPHRAQEEIYTYIQERMKLIES